MMLSNHCSVDSLGRGLAAEPETSDMNTTRLKQDCHGSGACGKIIFFSGRFLYNFSNY
jgi:hypothetical protein